MPIKVKYLRARSKKFTKNQDGATAVEFALVAIPFFALIFAIIELAIIFFINSVLSNAVSESGRVIRVGQFENCGVGQKNTSFKNLVCSNMNNLAQCTSNLSVNVISQPSFNQIVVPPPVNLIPDPNNPGQFIAPNGADFSPINASSPVVIQATFYYRLALPPQLTRLESTPGSGVRLIKSTTAFRTEPFPGNEPCPSNIQTASAGNPPPTNNTPSP